MSDPTAAISTKKDMGPGSRVHLPVMVPDALVFFAEPHATISDGIVSGTALRPTMAARLIVSNQVLHHVGWRGLI